MWLRTRRRGLTSSSRSAGPRAPRSSSRSAPSRAPCSRSSSACSGPASWSTPARIIGMPFSLEGFAFFTEAIFLGIYLYGWDRVSRARHWSPGVVVALERRALGLFVVIANALDELADRLRRHRRQGRRRSTRSRRCSTRLRSRRRCTCCSPRMPPPASASRASTRSCCCATRRIRSTATRSRCRLVVGALAAALAAAQRRHRPRASSPSTSRSSSPRWRGTSTTERGAPLHIGGWPDVETRETRCAIKIPYGLSFLAFHDPNAEVRRPRTISRATTGRRWRIVHIAFQIMVGCGHGDRCASRRCGAGCARRCGAAALADAARCSCARSSLATPLGFIAIEAGWTVTEVGRQPWIIYGVMRTADAVTPMPGLVVPFLVFSLLYVAARRHRRAHAAPPVRALRATIPSAKART